MRGRLLGFPWAMPFSCPSAGIGLVRSQHLHLGDTSTGELRGPPAILHVTPSTEASILRGCLLSTPVPTLCPGVGPAPELSPCGPGRAEPPVGAVLGGLRHQAAVSRLPVN